MLKITLSEGKLRIHSCHWHPDGAEWSITGTFITVGLGKSESWLKMIQITERLAGDTADLQTSVVIQWGKMTIWWAWTDMQYGEIEAMIMNEWWKKIRWNEWLAANTAVLQCLHDVKCEVWNDDEVWNGAHMMIWLAVCNLKRLCFQIGYKYSKSGICLTQTGANETGEFNSLAWDINSRCLPSVHGPKVTSDDSQWIH